MTCWNLNKQSPEESTFGWTVLFCHSFLFCFFLRPVLWNGPVRLSTIACEHDILKNACLVGFTFWYGITTKTSDTFDLGHSMKTKMVTTAVSRLTCTLCRILVVNVVDWKLLVRLNSYFDMALIPLRPWALLIWGILQKPRWPPQQFED